MEIVLTLDKKDWDAFLFYCNRSLPKKVKGLRYSFTFILAFLAAHAFFVFKMLERFSDYQKNWVIIISIFSVAVGVTVILMYSQKLRKSFEPNKEGIFNGLHKFTFTNDGVEIEGTGYKSTYCWLIVKNIERSEKLILIFLDTSYAVVLPVNKIKDPDALYRYITEKYNARKLQSSS